MLRPVEVTSQIPVLTNNLYDELFDSLTGLSKLDFGPVEELLPYAEPRRIFSPREVSLVLYQVGASLINSGMAYQTNVFAYKGNRLQTTRSIAVDAKAIAHRNVLLAYYQELPTQQPLHGTRTLSCNPFHALFILKVALDHMPLKLLEDLNRYLAQPDIIDRETIEFPNTSSFYLCDAILHILTAAIKLRITFADDIAPTNMLNLCSSLGLLAAHRNEVLDKLLKTEMIQVLGPMTLNPVFITKEQIDHIVMPLQTYVNARKAPFFGHKHLDRATPLIVKIQTAKTLPEIYFELKREMYFFMPENVARSYCFRQQDLDFKSQAATYKTPSQSGYYRALESSLEACYKAFKPTLDASNESHRFGANV